MSFWNIFSCPYLGEGDFLKQYNISFLSIIKYKAKISGNPNLKNYEIIW